MAAVANYFIKHEKEFHHFVEAAINHPVLMELVSCWLDYEL